MKEVKFIRLPYFGYFSLFIRKQSCEMLKHSFPHIKYNIAFTDSFHGKPNFHSQ